MNIIQADFVDYQYQNGEIYSGIGIGGGYLHRDYYISNQNNYLGNSAFFNILMNLIKEKIGDVEIETNVFETSSSIIFKTNPKKFWKDLEMVLKTLCVDNCSYEEFEEAKNITRKRFEQNYKSEYFRGRMKALEFAQLNKQFSLSRLIHDIDEITYEDFENSKEKLVVPGNIYLFSVGAVNGIKKDNLSSFDFLDNMSNHEVGINNNRLDPFLREDMYIVSEGRNEAIIEVLCFDSAENEVDPVYKRTVLEVYSLLMESETIDIFADGVDASLLFSSNELKEYKEKIIEFDEKKYEKIEKIIKNKYLYYIKEYPKYFLNEAIVMGFCGYSILQLMEIINGLNYNSFVQLVGAYNFKLSEAQIVFRKVVSNG